jgi:hypothetical protein
MAGTGLKSAKQKKGYIWYKKTAMHQQGNHIKNASQELTFHKFGLLTGLTLL